MNKLHLRIGSDALTCTSLLSAVHSRPRPQLPNATASGIVLAIDPPESKVHWTVDSTLHTVHGTFARAAKIASLHSRSRPRRLLSLESYYYRRRQALFGAAQAAAASA